MSGVVVFSGGVDSTTLLYHLLGIHKVHEMKKMSETNSNHVDINIDRNEEFAVYDVTILVNGEELLSTANADTIRDKDGSVDDSGEYDAGFITVDEAKSYAFGYVNAKFGVAKQEICWNTELRATIEIA